MGRSHIYCMLTMWEIKLDLWSCCIVCSAVILVVFLYFWTFHHPSLRLYNWIEWWCMHSSKENTQAGRFCFNSSVSKYFFASLITVATILKKTCVIFLYGRVSSSWHRPWCTIFCLSHNQHLHSYCNLFESMNTLFSPMSRSFFLGEQCDISFSILACMSQKT